MNIYLTHPVHGAKVATMELEAEMDEKNGWSRYTETDSVPKQENKLRRGRPAPVAEAQELGA